MGGDSVQIAMYTWAWVGSGQWLEHSRVGWDSRAHFAWRFCSGVAEAFVAKILHRSAILPFMIYGPYTIGAQP